MRKKEMKAEEAALKAYPDDMGTLQEVKYILRTGFIKGYEQAQKTIISTIESRLSELLGDAQPTPALRAELWDLINKIKED